MSYSEEELWALLDEVEDMPSGAGMIALVEQVIEHADPVGSPALAFTARMIGTRAYVRGGDPERSFLTFSWCLDEFDRDPGAHDEASALELLWHFKWMVGGLTAFPEVPLDRTLGVLDDMERRYRAGGHSPHAVHSHRHEVAEHIGDLAGADRWYDMWCAAPRDDLSDCEGCDPTAKVKHLVRRGRDEEALALAEPVLTGQLTCSEQPQDMLTALLLPYLRTGRLDEAREAHRRAYQHHRPNVENLAAVGRHVEFCALTGNEPRGLEIIGRHLSWLDLAPSPWAAMEFSSAAALVLRRLTASGHGGQTIRRDGAAVTVADLADQLAARAMELAGRFDVRNGTAHQSGRITRRLALEPLVDLPLSATARRRPRPIPAEPSPAPPATEPSISEQFAAAGPAELLDLAEAHSRNRDDTTVSAIIAVFDARFGDTELDPHTAARRTMVRGSTLADRLDFNRAQQCWEEAADQFRRTGDEIRRQVTLGMLGVLRCMSDQVDVGLTAVEESTAYLIAHAEPDRHSAALLRLSTAFAVAGRLEEALAAAVAAIGRAEAGDLARMRGEALVHRALCLSRLERFDEFAEAAAAAIEANRPYGGRGLTAACALLAERLVEEERYGEAVDAYDEAVRATDNATMAADLRLRRGQARFRAGRTAEAIDDLIESVALAAESGAERIGAQARLDLAVAYRESGRMVEAAEAAEEAVDVLTGLGFQDGSDRARYLLVQIYKDLEQPDAALPLLDTLAQNLDGFDNLSSRGQMHEEAGEVLYQLDRDGQAAARFAAAALAYHQAGLVLDEIRARRKVAAALVWADRMDQALAAMVTADELADSLPPDLAADPAAVYERGMLAYEGTKIFIMADRVEEALSRIGGVSRQFRSINAFREALVAEWLVGDVLMRLGRAGEAEPVLRTVATGLPRDDEALHQVAWLLSESLEAQALSADAAAVRAEYGLDEPSSPPPA